ncbi:peptidylprolyl isomerase [Novosphingobium sp.]|uniref:peptidylprolyl isomerase n=1 Tax=Novosphingobium sp. TaxID=1874826 RepID=UPI0028A8DC98|nr:peptidylprolyl isomerase [Novosphingobium sp.]
MKAIQRNTFIKRTALACGALVVCGAGAATLSSTAVFAQSAQGEIVVPDDVKIFGNDNPNVRRATAVVNGAVITGTDVDQRLALILAANQGKISEDEQKRLRLQVLRNLIDETLQIQEAKAVEVSVEDAEVDQSYARVASQNFNQNTQAMDAYLKRVGSSPESLKRQIRGELSWQRLLQRNVQPFINVSDDEVNEVIDRLKASKGTEEYRLGEIYLAATPETQQQVEANANQVMQQLRQGGSFVAYARQYSQASTAPVGGDLGWVRLGQLPGEVSEAVRDMQPGQLAGPIAIPGGYDIVYLIDKRQVLTADPRDAVLALKQISIEFPKGVSETQANARAENFAKTIKTAKGCGDVDKVAATIGAQVVANDQVKARDLPGPIQSSILNLSPGETLPPFGSLTEGVRILMLCGRDDPQVDSGPNFEQVMAQLEDDRVNKRAQMYLRDLRRDAVIEYN